MPQDIPFCYTYTTTTKNEEEKKEKEMLPERKLHNEVVFIERNIPEKFSDILM